MRSTLPPLLAALGARLWSPSSSGVRPRPPGRRGATITLGAVTPNTSFSPTPSLIMSSSSECRTMVVAGFRGIRHAGPKQRNDHQREFARGIPARVPVNRQLRLRGSNHVDRPLRGRRLDRLPWCFGYLLLSGNVVSR